MIDSELEGHSVIMHVHVHVVTCMLELLDVLRLELFSVPYKMIYW